MKIDVIILVTKKNLDVLKIMLPYCNRNILNKGQLRIISKKDNEAEINSICPGSFYDEDTVLPGLTYLHVQEIIEKLGGDIGKTGWYFQQFLKLAWAYQYVEDDYIVIDADTIPLSELSFIDSNGKYIFTKKTEFNKPYFDTIENLFCGKVKRVGNYSFVAEHMIFSSLIVKEMLNQIMNNTTLCGDNFYEKILEAVGAQNLKQSGFSEFETYGNYIMTYYPEKCVIKSYRTQREAVYILGDSPSDAQLKWANESYDIISIEVPGYGPTIITLLTKSPLFRAIFSMRNLSRFRYLLRRKLFS
jgi:hypothetical protein